MAEKSGLKFLADENISPVLVQILRKLGAGFIESMHSKPEKGTPDENWIPLYSERGYVIVSPDRKQLRESRIASVLAASGARAIYLPRKFADSKKWDQALWLLRHWWKLFERADKMSQKGEVVIFNFDGSSYKA